MTSIPRIDVTPLIADPSGEAARHAAAAILGAATGSGFMTLTGYRAALGLPEDAHARLLRFFALPESARMALARRKFVPDRPNVYRGYFPVQDGGATYKEGIDIGPDAVDPSRVAANGDPLAEPTPWPSEDDAPGWRADVALYFTAMERLGRAVVTALGRGLGAEEGELERLFDRGNSTLRMIRYPERPAESLPQDLETVRVAGDRRFVVGGAHVDSGFVTLLWQDPSGGLQARDAAGGWTEVPPVEDGLAVNFGALLADWSGGRIRATEHRVLGGLAERCSIPFFFEPAVDAVIAPLGGGEGYVYGDKLWERMSAFVEFRGISREAAA